MIRQSADGETADRHSHADRNLSALVAELVDGERVVVSNDAAAAVLGHRRPPTTEVDRVRRLLTSVGYEADPEDGP